MPHPPPASSAGAVTLPRVILLLSGAWFSFWACAPPSTLPAPIPMAKGSGVELGGGAVLSAVAGEDCRVPEDAVFDTGIVSGADCQRTIQALPDLAHWGTVPLTDQWAVGWQLSGGMATPGIAGGVMGRYDFTKSDRMLIGPQLELGIAWGSIGLPASVRVGDDLWLYTHPSFGYRMNGLARMPVGLGIPLGERLRLDVEAGFATPLMQATYTRFDSLSGVRTWTGVGLSTQVGR